MSVKYLKNGMVTVLFNTACRWNPYEIVDNGHKVVLKVFDQDGYMTVYEQDVLVPNSCVLYHMQEKDQVEVLFIPVDTIIQWEDE